MRWVCVGAGGRVAWVRHIILVCMYNQPWMRMAEVDMTRKRIHPGRVEGVAAVMS